MTDRLASMKAMLAAIKSQTGKDGHTEKQKAAMANLQNAIDAIERSRTVTLNIWHKEKLKKTNRRSKPF